PMSNSSPPRLLTTSSNGCGPSEKSLHGECDRVETMHLMTSPVPRVQRQGVRLAAATLALLGAGLLAEGCDHHHLVSDAEIEALCGLGGIHPSPTCVRMETARRDEAEALGCGAQFAAFVRCVLGPDPNCDGSFTPVDECGLQHDPNSVCIRAGQHADA